MQSQNSHQLMNLQQSLFGNTITYTYSPNWYRLECFHIHTVHGTQFVLYASNYTLYHYNLSLKVIIRDLCIRSVALKYKEYNINPKNLKIQAISTISLQSSELKAKGSLIFITLNQPFLIILNLQTFQILKIVKKQKYGQNGIYCLLPLAENNIISLYSYGDDNTINKTVLKCNFQPQQSQNKTCLKSVIIDDQLQASYKMQEKIRFMKLIQFKTTSDISRRMLIIVTCKGQIQFYSTCMQNMNGMITGEELKIGNHFIISMDTFHGNLKNYQMQFQLVLLTKNRQGNNFVVHISLEFNFENKDKIMLKQIENSAYRSQKVELKVIYPKIMFQKVKKYQKAAMSIKILKSNAILVTGKLGEIFIIYLDILQKYQLNDSKKEDQKKDENKEKNDGQKENQVITIKPHSLDGFPPFLQICDDSKHYRQIYAIYQSSVHPETIFMLSTDQTWSQWQISSPKKETGKLILRCTSLVRFLTSQVKSIFYSEYDSKTIFILLRDSIIRSCSPLPLLNNTQGLQQKHSYLNQYWKFTKKFKIIKVAAHLQQFGVTAMQTQCGQILFFDLFQDRLMRIIQIPDFSNGKIKNQSSQVINITFEFVSILKPLEDCINTIVNLRDNLKINTNVEEKMEQVHRWEKIPVRANQYYQKQQNNQIGLLVQLRDRFLFFQPPNENKIQGNDKRDNKIICHHIYRPCKIERVSNTKIWDHSILVFSQVKANILKVWVYFNTKIGYLEQKLSYQSSRCIFKILKGEISKHLLIFEFKNKKMNLSLINLDTIQEISITSQLKKEVENLHQNKNVSTNESEEIKSIEIDLPLTVQQVVLDYWSNQLIAYNQKDDVIAYLNFDNHVASFLSKNKQQPLRKFVCYSMKSKIQTVSFYEIQNIVVGFKDQSLKIMKINALSEKQGKNEEIKKINKKQQVISKPEQDKAIEAVKISQKQDQ